MVKFLIEIVELEMDTRDKLIHITNKLLNLVNDEKKKLPKLMFV